MEMMWVEGQYRPVAQPVKMLNNSSVIDLQDLENYVTKDLLDEATKDLNYNQDSQTLEIID